MTRTLILTRHAKSSWATLGVTDHDRPLNKRGRESAKVVGDWLRHKGWIPDEVLSSSAERTRETWQRMGLQADLVAFTPNLYHAGPHQMMETLINAQGQTVLMLGHNPGIAEFAERIVQAAPDHPRFYDYPTCATTVLQFDATSWSQAKWHTGEIRAFVIPRELQE